MTSGRAVTLGGDNFTIGDISNAGLLKTTAANYAVGLYNATSIGNILNSGTIESTQRHALVLNHSTAGNITNSGMVAGNTQYGVSIVNGSSVGTVSNSGTITAARGINATGSTLGSVTNSGTINGQLNGIVLSDSAVTGDIRNTATGQITTQTSSGIRLSSGSTAQAVINDGAITGFKGIVISSSSVTSVTNNGQLASSGQGIFLTSGSSADAVSNAGSITSTNGDGIQLSAATVSSVSNSGAINAANNGVSLASASSVDSLRNTAGAVIAAGSKGIAINGSSVGSIVNDGSITGAIASILVDGGATVTGGIINSGTLTGKLDIVGTGLIDLTNSGAIDIGQSESRLSGDYAQTDTGIFNVTLMNIGDYLIAPMLIGGNALIDGQLVIGGLDNLNLPIGLRFTLFDILGSRTGVFANYGQGTVVGYAKGEQYRIDYTVEGDIQLYVQSDVPEPGTLILFGLGALGFRARRRKAG